MDNVACINCANKIICKYVENMTNLVNMYDNVEDSGIFDVSISCRMFKSDIQTKTVVGSDYDETDCLCR